MKQKHSLRLLAGLVALTLCVCLIAGCGDEKKNAASDQSTASAAEAGTTSVKKGVICRDNAFVRSTPGLAEDNKLGDLKKTPPSSYSERRTDGTKSNMKAKRATAMSPSALSKSHPLPPPAQAAREAAERKTVPLTAAPSRPSSRSTAPAP